MDAYRIKNFAGMMAYAPEVVVFCLPWWVTAVVAVALVAAYVFAGAVGLLWVLAIVATIFAVITIGATNAQGDSPKGDEKLVPWAWLALAVLFVAAAIIVHLA